ncbi:hypothetical protein NL474_28930, partial [Klebsiella pneumoniae]|nr:hypothetical protein [Klebsiella pneumoniae]
GCPTVFAHSANAQPDVIIDNDKTNALNFIVPFNIAVPLKIFIKNNRTQFLYLLKCGQNNRYFVAFAASCFISASTFC